MSQPRATSERTPALLRLAQVFMLVAALVAMVGALATITTYSRAMDASNSAFENTADGLANPGVFALIMQIHIGICALTALGLVVLTFFMVSGSDGARVATIVFCVFACAFATAATFINPGTFGSGGPPGDAVTIATVKSAEGIPAWARAVQMYGPALDAVLLATIVVLLTVGLSRAIKARAAASQTAAV